MPHFTRDGRQLFYRQGGSGELLLILPGNTASSASHSGEMDYFGARFTTLSLDFWGTGQSERQEEWPENWYEIAAYDAAALIEHMGEESAYVMGTSGGAIVALLMAIHHPQRVRGLIADSTLERFARATIKHAIASRKQRLPSQIKFWREAHGDDWESVVDADSDMLQRFYRKTRGNWSSGRLKEISCPVLLTASLEDSALPNIGKQVMSMSQQIPNSRAFLTSQGDHPLMWSHPEDFRHVSDYFLTRISSSNEALSKE